MAQCNMSHVLVHLKLYEHLLKSLKPLTFHMAVLEKTVLFHAYDSVRHLKNIWVDDVFLFLSFLETNSLKFKLNSVSPTRSQRNHGVFPREQSEEKRRALKSRFVYRGNITPLCTPFISSTMKLSCFFLLSPLCEGKFNHRGQGSTSATKHKNNIWTSELTSTDL